MTSERTACVYAPGPQLPLARAVAGLLDLPVGNATVGHFEDGERNVRIHDPVAGQTVILLASTGPPVDSNLMSLALLADAARRSGAARIVAVVPYFGYSRGERLGGPGSPVPCRVAADLLVGAGVNHLVTADLHSPAIAGFFTLPVDEISAVSLLAARFEGADPDRHVVVAPDAGAVKRVGAFAALLNLPMAIATKVRTEAGGPKLTRLWGDVAGREAILYDDMVATGSTLVQVAEGLVKRGVTGLAVATTHAVMAPGAEERLRAIGVRRFVTTDTLPYPAGAEWPALEVVSVAPLLAQAVGRALGRRPAGTS